MSPDLAERLNAWADLWRLAMWRACWQGALFILVVWGVCRWLPRLSPHVRHCLWLLACLKLILSLVCLTPIRLPVLPPARNADTAFAPPNIELAPSPIGAEGEAKALRNTPTLPAVRSMLSPGALLCAVWGLGILALCAVRLQQYVGLRSMIARAEPLQETSLGAEARQLGLAIGLPRSPRLFQSSEITAPLVVGLWQPIILLPEGFAQVFGARERRMALAHELAHIRRRDLWFALIPTLANLFFFFFPPAWLACREWAAAREAVCDADALRLTGASAGAYSRMLLKLVVQDARPAPAVALGATANYHTLHYRLLLLKQRSAPMSPALRFIAAVLSVVGLACTLPISITSAPTLIPLAERPRHTPGIERIPTQEWHAGGDPQMRYLLHGPKTGAPPPAEGYRLLLVLPGGDGGPNFRWFVKRIGDYALPDDYLVAELIAPKWTAEQAYNLVWPTRANTMPGVMFVTEEFVEAVIHDVKRRTKVDPRFIFTLGWASGGPPGYAVLSQPRTQVTGAFIAMSVYNPQQVPNPAAMKGRALYLLQPTDVSMAPLSMAQAARDQLQARGASVELATYQGDYGWHGPVYQQIQRGIDWLERRHSDAAQP